MPEHTQQAGGVRRMHVREIIEALIFSANGSLPAEDILKAVPGANAGDLDSYVSELNRMYEETDRSFRIERVSDGYQYVTREAYAPYLKLLHTPVRLSMPSLEVLAVVAYKGPCSKQAIDSIRGVDSTSSLKSLLKHRLIDIKHGKPLLYHTTTRFLEVFGLDALADLPDLKQFEEVFREEPQGVPGEEG
ncbi:MAG: SMC-Scp complex subunit ScpB [Desulfomonilia bacterium]|nr:SMC-Scp complex subunit ScpB [Desulfomonilia bacterium]HPW69674.1 SMC-Scp complex subunit ScpB [Deltaproteobacteria bacterium]